MGIEFTLYGAVQNYGIICKSEDIETKNYNWVKSSCMQR